MFSTIRFLFLILFTLDSRDSTLGLTGVATHGSGGWRGVVLGFTPTAITSLFMETDDEIKRNCIYSNAMSVSFKSLLLLLCYKSANNLLFVIVFDALHCSQLFSTAIGITLLTLFTLKLWIIETLSLRQYNRYTVYKSIDISVDYKSFRFWPEINISLTISRCQSTHSLSLNRTN